MSSGTTTPLLLPSETPVASPPTECEVMIQQRIEQARRQVKGVDIADGLITLAIGMLAYLLVAAAVDHWLIVGGLGFWGRLCLWLVLMGTAGTYFVRRVLLPLARRINPLFAAATIENSRPSLKNSLINFMLLRDRRREVVPIVYQAMERRAASDLANVEMDVAVDRTRVIRLGYVLLGVLTVFCLYLLISPKNPIRSATRILWPWSSVESPTRVTIRDIQPGNAVAFHGEFVTVSADIAGLREGEQALVIYSTADGQTVDQAVPMTRPEDDYRSQCRLPPESLGLQQDLSYRIEAGDCRSDRYRIETQIAPAIVIDKISYHYPSYTRLADRTVEGQRDLSAIEGTEVAIHATANTEIKQYSADIDLGCTGRHGRRMTTDGCTAIGHFTLRLNPQDTSAPEYSTYQLLFSDSQGRKNPRPSRYRIEVIRDWPPEVELVEPQTDVRVAVDGRLPIKVWAKDPDFALRRIVLRAQCNDTSLPIAPLMDHKKPEDARQSEFSAVYWFEPARLRLKAGDRVKCWVEADDNKEPMPGHAVSGERSILVVAADAAKSETDRRTGDASRGEQEGDQAASGGREKSSAEGNKPSPSGDESNQPQGASADAKSSRDGKTNESQGESAERSKAGEQSGSPQPGQSADKEASPTSAQEQGQQQSAEQSSGQQQGTQGTEKSNKRIDPDKAPGDAMQEILKDRQQQQQSKSDKSSSQGQQADQKPQSDEQQTAGEEQAGDQQAGKPSESSKTEEQKAGGEKGQKGEKGKGDEKASGEESGSEKSSSEKGAGSEKSGGKDSDANATTKQSNETANGERTDQEAASGDRASKKDENGEKGGTGEKREVSGSHGKEDGSEKGVGSEKPGGEKSGSAAGGKEQTEPSSEQSAERQKSGEQQSGKQSSPGEGQNIGKDAGSPSPQEKNQDRQKKSGKASETPDERKDDTAQSPSTSEKQSDSTGETAGDRSGGGQQGGGQQAKQRGTGGPGSHTPADEGGSAATEQGQGEVGNRPGDQSISKKSIGNATTKQPGETVSGNRGGENGEKGGEVVKGVAGDRAGATKDGIPIGGGKPGTGLDNATASELDESPADRANLEYARRQSTLALEHLRDQMAKEKPKLLERLGWSKDDARRFIERWEAMHRAAAERSSAGESARKQLDAALRSLELRPRGAELRRGGTTIDQPQNLRDAGRFAPPPDWTEQFREYTRGVAGSERNDK